MKSDGIDAWAVLTVVCAAAVAAPLIGLPLSFAVAPGSLSEFSGLVPEAAGATVVLVVGVGAGTLVLGTALAALVSFCDFPGRGWIEWALVLPLAMPGYVFTLFALGLDLPGLRSSLGAVCVFTLVLYPYVYLLARAAFLAQSRTLLEAARGLGLSRGAAIVRVALPLARPAILGGVALALMEALADFGTVNLRDLPGLVHRLRPRRRHAAGHPARVGHAHPAGPRAPRPGTGPLPPAGGQR